MLTRKTSSKNIIPRRIRSKFGLKFRQLTRTNHFIQLIYDDDDQLIDCEFGHDQNQTKTFLSSFKRDLSNLITTSNLTVESLDGKELPRAFLWMNYSHLRDDCKHRHRELRQNIKKERVFLDNQRFPKRSKRSIFILPGTNWCGDRNRARKYTDVGSMMLTDRCCRRHDFCKMDIPGMTKKYNYFNYRLFTLSHCRCDRRSKRNVDDIFRVPGTKWCGKGYSADKYTRLGGFSRTDRCCRKHDLRCPFWINGFETKYGLFNWRINTLMHCNCDERPSHPMSNLSLSCNEWSAGCSKRAVRNIFNWNGNWILF
uniref:phospholipase A2 n=1 Tax=Diabrotica virgifera virgifera TaxID=50390 RepID=A0A6P7G844_DIAVI